jgi:spore germination protein
MVRRVGMQIHVIQRGQSLQGIAQTYGTTVDDIMEANEMKNQHNLVPGQSLVIPIIGSFYWVKEGDTLWSISRQYKLPYQELARVNRISANQSLKVGVRLYIPPAQKTKVEINAYIEPTGHRVVPELENAVREAESGLTYLATFSYQALRDGNLREPITNPFTTIARENNNQLMMVITNQENGLFNEELGQILLNDMAIQDQLLDNIVSTAQKNRFRAIHFDFEFLRPDDREAYNQFLRKAKARFSEHRWMLSTALAPKVKATGQGQWDVAHDYRAHGEIADFVVIISYAWGNSRGPAMAISPLDTVRKVIEYAKTEMPAHKILMGQNLYGYDWTLPYVPGTTAKALSPQQAVRLASERNVTIHYDSVTESPFFHYTDNQGKRHEVWFEDARSIQAKCQLIKELGIRGISYWKLGLSFPQNWLLIDDHFQVIKR